MSKTYEYLGIEIKPRWKSWVFEIATSATTEVECARSCSFYYTSSNPCELYSFDGATNKCYIGNMATDQNIAVPAEQLSDVWFEPGV